MKKIILPLLMAAFCYATSFAQCTGSALSGTYTIDLNASTGGSTFKTFTDVANALNSCGITGSVIFNVKPGLYTEQISISNVPGSGGSRFITFRRDPASSGTAEIRFAASSTASNYVFNLDGTDNVRIENLTVNAIGTSFGRGISMTGDANNIRITNNTINGTGSSISDNFAAIYDAPGFGNQISDLQIVGNNIQKGSYAIYLRGASETVRQNNIVIDDNTIANYYYMGVYLYGHNGAQVTENTISSRFDYTFNYGVYNAFSNSNQVLRNTIELKGTNTNYGIFQLNCDGASSNPVLVANNFVSTENAAVNSYGIFVENNNQTDIFHNSVNLTDGTVTGGRAIFLNRDKNGSFTNIDVINNIFVNSGGGYAVEITQDAFTNNYVSSMNYNDLFVTGNELAAVGANDYADLPQWQAATPYGNNSVSADPGFASFTNLRPVSNAVNNSGTPLSSVNTDIDGQARSTTKPDMGADEFTPPACSPSSNLSGSSSSPTSITVSFAPGSGSSFRIIYGQKGFNPNTPAGRTIVSNVSGSPFTVTGLTTQVTYDFYVQDVCGGSFSALSSVLTIPPQCAPFPLPFSEDFNSSSNLPLCFSEFDPNNNAVFIVGPSQCAGSAGNSLQIDGFLTTPGNVNTGVFAVSSEIDASNQSSVQVSYDIRRGDNSNCGNKPEFFDSVTVEYWDGNQWRYLKSHRGGNTPATFTTQTANVTSGLTSSFKLRFRIGLGSGAGFDNFNFDNILVTAGAPCPPSTVNSASATICQGQSIFLGGANRTTAGVYKDVIPDQNGCDSIVTNTTLTVLPSPTVNRNVEICQGQSFFAGGANQTTSGVYTDVFTAANGCDSTVNTNLTVNPNKTTSATAQICQGESIFLGGAFQTQAGVYSDVFTSAAGCDSTVNTTLTVTPNKQSSASVSFCDGDSALVNGQFVTVAGVYRDTFALPSGCDSIFSTNVSVLPAAAGSTDVMICQGDSAFIAGQFRTQGGTYSETFTAANGCDSIFSTTLWVMPITTGTASATICDGQSIFLGGALQTTAGTYSDTLTDVNGCDSILSTTLTVLPNVTVNIDTTITAPDSLFAGGAFQTTSGIYTDVFTAANGCDSTVITDLTVEFRQVVNVQADICNGDSIFVGGAFQTMAGVYSDTLMASDGKDSIVNTTVNVIPATVNNVSVQICQGDSVLAGGAFQTTAGTYTDVLTGSNGCDSILNTTVNVLPAPTNSVSASICEGDSIFLAGAFRTAAGVFTQIFTGANGCDSTVTTTLSLLPNAMGSQSVEICEGESFFVGGAAQFVSGIYSDTLPAANGCDSIVMTTLTVNPEFSQTVPAQICQGDSIFLEGEFQTTAGTYVDTFQTVNGCDSILTTNLTVDSIQLITNPVSLCDGDSVLVNGMFVSTSGTFNDTSATASGCDSVFSTVVTVLPNASGSASAAICQGDSIFVGGAYQTTAGDYIDILTAANGCDSVMTTTVSVNPSFSVLLSADICQGDSVLAGGAFRTTSGVFTDNFTTAEGCDSTIITTVNVLPIASSSSAVSICQGESVLINGILRSQAGLYRDTLTAANGCDSIAMTTLTVNPVFNVAANASICNGDSIFLGGGFQTVSGTYFDTLSTVNGCDSILSTTLAVGSTKVGTTFVDICQGDSVLVNGMFVSSAGTFSDTNATASGCDSIFTTIVNVLPISTSNLSVAICQGDSLFAGGSFQTGGAVYMDTLTAANGCDSVVSTTVTVNPVFNLTASAEICQGDSILLGGSFQTASGVYTDNFSTVNGCDSTIATTLTVLPNPVNNVSASICQGDSIFVDEGFQTTAGVYTDVFTAANGCDSIVNTTVSVIPVANVNADASICQGDSVFLGGAFRSTSGTFADTLQATSGCDSIVNTTLTVDNFKQSLNIVMICNGESTLVNGVAISVDTVIIDTLTAASGCDSIHTTAVSVLPNAASSQSASICDGDSILLGGTFQTMAGTFVDTLVSANGCDSVITTALTVNPVFDIAASVEICLGDSALVAGAFRDTAGVFTENFTSANGCDSSITTTVLVIDARDTNIVVQVCQGESLLIAGQLRSAAGTYTDTLTGANGCDSIVSTTLIVNPVFNQNATASICQGDSIFLGGAFQTASGTFVDSLTTAAGCDSLISTTLTVLPNASATASASICQGDSIFLGGAFQTAAGNFVDTFTAANGCDSILTTQLSVNPTFSTPVLVEICDGDSVFVDGAFRTASGVFTENLTSVGGCDSTVITTVNVLPNSIVNQSAEICQGESIFLAGAVRTSAGIYSDTLMAANGCDSIVNTTLIVNPVFNQNATASICQGDSIFLGGAFQTASGIFVDSLTTTAGCDSLLTTALTVGNAKIVTNPVSICQGESILVNGQVISMAGTFNDTNVAASGCDSIFSTIVTVLPNSAKAITVEICQGETVFAGGDLRSTAGVYFDTLQAANGCDSVLTTTVIVNPAFQVSANAQICTGDSILLGGSFRTTAGVYFDTLATVNGCDSTVATTLTIDNLQIVTNPVNLCNGDSILVNGMFVFSAGVFNDTIVRPGDCDSVFSTIVSILPKAFSADTLSICQGDSILLDDAFRTTAGKFVDTLIAANGCDSIATTILNVLPNTGLTVTDSICPGDSLFVGGAFQTTAGSYMDVLTAANGCDSILTTVVSLRTDSACFGDTASQQCVSIVTDGTWTLSTLVTQTNLEGEWEGADTIPATSTFTNTVNTGQPYGFNSVNQIAGTQVLSTGPNIVYFRKTFNLASVANLSARLQTNVDDQADIYINGQRVALINTFGRLNFKFPAHDVKFIQGGLTANGFMGGDPYDVVTTAPLANVFQQGQNEVIVVVRNLNHPQDMGGLSFKMDINCDNAATTANVQKTAVATTLGEPELKLFPNPTLGMLNVETTVALMQIAVHDMSGKLIFVRDYEADKEAQIQTGDWANGIYLVKITELGGETTVKKVIKE